MPVLNCGPSWPDGRLRYKVASTSAKKTDWELNARGETGARSNLALPGMHSFAEE